MKALMLSLSLMMLFGCASQEPLTKDAQARQADQMASFQKHDHDMHKGMSCKHCKHCNKSDKTASDKKMSQWHKNDAEKLKMMKAKDHKMCGMHKNMPNKDLTSKNTPSKVKKTCLNANRPMRGFKVLSRNTFLVDYGRHDYLVTVNPSCDLSGAEKISFTQMPERTLRMDGRTIFATQLQNGHICGTGFDSVVSRRRGEDFYTMGHSCRVQSVVEVSDTDTK